VVAKATGTCTPAPVEMLYQDGRFTSERNTRLRSSTRHELVTRSTSSTRRSASRRAEPSLHAEALSAAGPPRHRGRINAENSAGSSPPLA